jgi:hypothetical protein
MKIGTGGTKRRVTNSRLRPTIYGTGPKNIFLHLKLFFPKFRFVKSVPGPRNSRRWEASAGGEDHARAQTSARRTRRRRRTWTPGWRWRSGKSESRKVGKSGKSDISLISTFRHFHLDAFVNVMLFEIFFASRLMYLMGGYRDMADVAFCFMSGVEHQSILAPVALARNLKISML